MSSQISLPGFSTCRTPAERVFVSLAQTWQRECGAVERDRLLPRFLDEMALAALLLAVEHGSGFSRAASSEAHKNAVACEGRLLGWLAQLPWQLSTSFCVGLIDRAPLERLVGSLDHPQSNVRVWTLQLAWMVRRELAPHGALRPLLESVAFALIGVELAWGLAGELFDEEDDFVREAAAFKPQDFSEQYADRFSNLKNEPLVVTQAEFWRIESRCRRLITETAFSLALPEPDGELN